MQHVEDAVLGLAHKWKQLFLGGHYDVMMRRRKRLVLVNFKCCLNCFHLLGSAFAQRQTVTCTEVGTH